MGSISAALKSSANALQVFSQAFDTIENNITNSNTPGYARQDVSLEPLPFDPAGGLAGGVESGPLLNSRSEYLDQAVRNQQQLLGSAQQRASDLSQVEPLFDLTSSTGVASSINNFFNSFSQLSVNPNDQVSRQAVISSAGQLARNIQQSAAGITQVSVNAASQTGSVVSQINQLGAQIAGLNRQFQSSAQASQDEGLDTQMHTALENLSQLVNFTVLKSSDGSYNVSIGGQTPLVLGASAFPVSVSSPSNSRSPPGYSRNCRSIEARCPAASTNPGTHSAIFSGVGDSSASRRDATWPSAASR